MRGEGGRGGEVWVTPLKKLGPHSPIYLSLLKLEQRNKMDIARYKRKICTDKGKREREKERKK